MGYVMLMTFAGSALFVGYLCWKRVLGKSITQCMKYRVLMIVMLVYIIPWTWIKETYKTILLRFCPVIVDAGATGLVNIADYETKEMAIRTKEYQLLMLVMLIWFMLAVMFLFIRITKYSRKRRSLHALTIKCEDKNLEQTLRHVKEVVRYKHSVEVVWTRVDNDTFTIGAIKPIIFLQKDYKEGDLYWILKHEMTHIAKRDLWVKLLLEFVCCLHWFNPLVYLLGKEISHLCESSCDERVTKGCTEEECETYIDLLNRNRSHKKLKDPFTSAVKGGEIDKRIALIRNRKYIPQRDKALTICAFGFLIFLDSLTALAYPKVYHVKNVIIEMAEDSVNGGNFWIYDFAEDGYGTFSDVIVYYDEQFEDKNGKIYPIDSTGSETSCSKHQVISGIAQIHEKDKDGGCTIEFYEATRCTECGAVWKEDITRKARRILCTH